MVTEADPEPDSADDAKKAAGGGRALRLIPIVRTTSAPRYDRLPSEKWGSMLRDQVSGPSEGSTGSLSKCELVDLQGASDALRISHIAATL